MKKSEDLKLQASQEDNDFKSLALNTKALREARLEKFEEKEYSLALERNNCIVIPFNGTKVTIDTQTDKFGVIDYFPKANKILIRKDNDWKTQGLKWMLDNIILV